MRFLAIKVQVERLDFWICKRRNLWAGYTSSLGSLSERESQLDLPFELINNFDIFQLDSKDFVKPQEAKKRNGIDALEHHTKPSTSPLRTFGIGEQRWAPGAYNPRALGVSLGIS